jgi:hypothetical protein
MPFVRVRGSWIVKHPAASLCFDGRQFHRPGFLAHVLSRIFQKNSLIRPSVENGVPDGEPLYPDV